MTTSLGSKYKKAGSDVANFDFMANLFLVVFVLFIALAAIVSKEKVEEDAQVKAPGQLNFYFMWDDKFDVDIDPHVQVPGGAVVSYRNRVTDNVRLVVDDTGQTVGSDNMEHIFADKLLEGEWVVNVHFYGSRDWPVPEVEVSVIVYLVNSESGGSPKKIEDKKVKLQFRHHEETAVRFKLDEDGKLVQGSVNDDPKPLAGGTFTR